MENQNRRIRRRFKLWHSIVAILLLLFVLFRIWGSFKLKKKIEVLRNQGYPVTLEELDNWYNIPAGVENSADVYMDAFSNYVEWDSEARKALPVVGRAPLPARTQPLDDPNKLLVEKFLSDNEKTLTLLHEAASIDHCRYPIDFRQHLGQPASWLKELRASAHLLQLDVLIQCDNHNFEKALTISREMDDMFGMADAQRGLGYIHWRLGEYDQAIEHYNKCIKFSMDIQDMHTIALAFIEIGNVYIETGEIKLAIEYYNKSLKGLESMGDYSEMARAYNNLGDSNLKSGNYDKAIEYFAKCQEMGKKIGRKDIVGWSLFNAGEAFALKGDAESAMENAQKALDILNIVGDKLGIMACYKIFGMVFDLREDWEPAIESFEKCVAIGGETKIPYIQGEVHFYYGKMLKHKGDTEKAKEQLNLALNIFESLDTEEFVVRIKKEFEDL